ncbi:regulatory protein RecX [Pontimicrobium aquaticum]|uniref:Regulatory protein RecX n=1 Tax=Pontimicrobium aquaticum TaxID=2565367 RepID=A0A4U0F5L3_9FLAO|nr:regulatory protein RecX [Pontimicrobium aquaticum]TJY38132.1 regulatory protein RecX [Pontimicrobium aquaticum]
MFKKRTYTLEEAKKALENYCAYQERYHKEVRQKLQGMYMIPEAIDVIIVHLLQHNYLNEERFTKAYVSGKLKHKKWGKQRLIQELKKRDISKVNITKALAEINDEEYLNIFNDLAEKKFGLIKERNIYKRKKKLADYLLYRGWEAFLVYDKVNELVT